MAKLKTRKTLAKRIKITKTGKVMVGALNNGHLKRKLTANAKSRKKGLRVFENNARKQLFKALLSKRGKNIDA
ncbi:MAG TPA: 50S ribosomal protein L35 [candidate division WWE3 bacterium]|uniref:50S ribosomal protein L35 n=1 Tax=candidate division WWE3 bacterium TaxID=2053526 RepID=A0A7C1HGH1_UNCKA|nr:50S ribosomal protein L35 [candidate division WWE3 bacterium]